MNLQLGNQLSSRDREEAHQGFQRVMGRHNGKHAPQPTKVKFDGNDKEEFLSKFGQYLAEAYGVAEIFYTDSYGLHQPNLNHQGRAGQLQMTQRLIAYWKDQCVIRFVIDQTQNGYDSCKTDVGAS